ncbi:MAG: adenosylcobinamide-GDP ribazoletransferase, partial [Candidatus Hydrothermarchaeaceae archaeon]
GIKGVFSFLTVLPLRNSSIASAARWMWLFPVVGIFIGWIAGMFGQAASLFFPVNVSSALALFVLLFLTGFHHLDGLLDFGDAAMLRGSRKKRLEIMHRKGNGTGAFALGFFVLLITYAALQSQDMVKALIVAEVSAKTSMVIGAYISEPANAGMGSEFVRAMKGKHYLFLLSFLIYLTVIYLLAPQRGVWLIISLYLSSVFMVWLSGRLIGGTSGDVFGAMNEVTRMITLLVLL